MFNADVIRLVIPRGLRRCSTDIHVLDTEVGGGLIAFFKVDDDVALDVLSTLVGWCASSKGLVDQGPTVVVEVLVSNERQEPFPALDKIVLQLLGILLVTQRIDRKGPDILLAIVATDGEVAADRPAARGQRLRLVNGQYNLGFDVSASSDTVIS